MPPEQQGDTYAELARALPFADRAQALTLGRARRAVVRILAAHGARTVLDMCCGTGAQARMLAQAGMDVTGLDGSHTMLARARALGGGPHYMAMEGETLNVANSFDGAITSLALHEMPPGVREEVWRAMRRAVRPGGLLIAMDYSPQPRPTLLGRLARKIVDADERSFAKVHLPHYENYLAFMAEGGLAGWLTTVGETPRNDRRFLFGNLAVLDVMT